eukprot:GEMP01012076.1.p1 GENE.GEMP01012076.1~~GEMP01012076.1.p1  ORF type:complete len:388 (+),score=88.50 GEMP01012076.1:150-1313(+)
MLLYKPLTLAPGFPSQTRATQQFASAPYGTQVAPRTIATVAYPTKPPGSPTTQLTQPATIRTTQPAILPAAASAMVPRVTQPAPSAQQLAADIGSTMQRGLPPLRAPPIILPKIDFHAAALAASQAEAAARERAARPTPEMIARQKAIYHKKIAEELARRQAALELEFKQKLKELNDYVEEAKKTYAAQMDAEVQQKSDSLDQERQERIADLRDDAYIQRGQLEQEAAILTQQVIQTQQPSAYPSYAPPDPYFGELPPDATYAPYYDPARPSYDPTYPSPVQHNSTYVGAPQPSYHDFPPQYDNYPPLAGEPAPPQQAYSLGPHGEYIPMELAPPSSGQPAPPQLVDHNYAQYDGSGGRSAYHYEASQMQPSYGQVYEQQPQQYYVP